MEIKRIYLAGPEVFLPNSKEIGDAKKLICQNHGFVGLYPLDNEITENGLTSIELAYRISAENEALIRSSHAVVANLTPFRGISADVGTVYELGFAAGLGKLIFAYSNVTMDLATRTCEYCGVESNPAPDGKLYDSSGLVIENFGLHDNLMLEGGMSARGAQLIVGETDDSERFSALAGFEQCVRYAASVMRTAEKR